MNQTTPRQAGVKLSSKGGISMPCLPNKGWKRKTSLLQASFQLVILVLCNLEIKTVQICGRNIPLIDLRSTLLRKQQEYMRLTTTTDIMKMTMDEILSFMKLINHDVDPTETLQQLQYKLKDYKHTRTVAICHDHSTILSTGYILFAVWVIYDTAVFPTEAEYKTKSGRQIPSVQSIIEEPEIYMLAPSSSSLSDQSALVSERSRVVAFPYC